MSRRWFCYWCKREVFKFSKLRNRIGLSNADPQPENLYTKDHVYHKGDSRRGHDCPTVVSCRKCNELRGAEFQRQRNNKVEG